MVMTTQYVRIFRLEENKRHLQFICALLHFSLYDFCCFCFARIGQEHAQNILQMFHIFLAMPTLIGTLLGVVEFCFCEFHTTLIIIMHRQFVHLCSFCIYSHPYRTTQTHSNLMIT